MDAKGSSKPLVWVRIPVALPYLASIVHRLEFGTVDPERRVRFSLDAPNSIFKEGWRRGLTQWS